MPSTIGMWAREKPGWLGEDAVGKRFLPVVIDSQGRARELADEYLILDPDHLASLGGFDIVRERASLDGVRDTVSTVNPNPLGARQYAVGKIFPEAAIPESLRTPVMMDFRDISQRPQASATFSYRVPLGGDRWLIEETILVSRIGSAEAMELLRENLGHRLGILGIDPARAIDDETVDFPVGPATVRSLFTGPQRFGVAGGWMHPATGYSVGASLADVDRFLDVVAGKRRSRKRRILPPGGLPKLWLRRRGLTVLLAFTPAQQRLFFDSFFTLPDSLIHRYLTGHGGTAGTLVAMASLMLPLGRRSPMVLGRLLNAFCTGRL